MPVVFQERITRPDIRAHSDCLYVFGDNLRKRGLGGLAGECRGEPNAVGIPTKRAPSMEESAFFSDGDLDAWTKVTAPLWTKLRDSLREGKTVVFPKAGLGTGLAQLGKRAPQILAAIDRNVRQLEQIGAQAPTARQALQMQLVALDALAGLAAGAGARGGSTSAARAAAARAKPDADGVKRTKRRR